MAALNILHIGPGCPPELLSDVQGAKLFSDVFENSRALSFVADCQVTVARDKRTGQQAVIKTYVKHQLKGPALLQVQTEALIHSSVSSHPHIVRMLLAFEDSRHIYVVVEYADGGDLRRHMGGMPERRVRDFIAAPLLQALAVLHHEGIVHRDLKPDNVLVHHNHVLLADFGLAMYTASSEQQQGQQQEHQQQHQLSRELSSSAASSAADAADGSSDEPDSSAFNQESSSSTSSSSAAATAAAPTSAIPAPASATPSGRHDPEHRRKRAELCAPLADNAGGTPLYTSPEVLLAMFKSQPMQAVVSPKNDVWALGVMVLEALTGSHPFSPENCSSYSGNVLYTIAHHKTVALPGALSPELKDFLSQALQRDPALRPSADDLLRHPWMCSGGSRGGAATHGNASGAAPQAHCRALSAGDLSDGLEGEVFTPEVCTPSAGGLSPFDMSLQDAGVACVASGACRLSADASHVHRSYSAFEMVECWES